VELSWLTKLRIVAALALGAIGLGLGAWPLVAPADPLGVVSASSIQPKEMLVLIVLSGLTGFAAYFLAWPHGHQIGVLSVPAALALWGIRSGEVFRLMQRSPDVPQRLGVYALLRWDSLFWLVLVGAGLAGLWVASRLLPAPLYRDPLQVSRPKTKAALDWIVGLLLGLTIGHVVVTVLAQGTRLTGVALPAQPAPAQIAFAAMVGFGAAGFVTGRLLRLGPFVGAAASAALPIVASCLYARTPMMETVERYYPATCFPSPVLAILPVQMVAFGALGATAGYWMAVRFEYWRTHLAT